uniref:Putative secreted protein n=1 Tax=Anopheles triannulatus TaxID=58253 RepID=A0A2M4B2D6_9DIPT
MPSVCMCLLYVCVVCVEANVFYSNQCYCGHSSAVQRKERSGTHAKSYPKCGVCLCKEEYVLLFSERREQAPSDSQTAS